MFRGIALSGKACAGKDRIGEALVHALANRFYDARIEKLASPIYHEAHTKYEMVGKNRPLLQKIGDDHTNVEPTYYVRLLCEAQDAIEKPGLWVVTDLRKVIEAEYLRQKGYALVRLDVEPAVQKSRMVLRDGGYNEESMHHWTETDLDDYTRWNVRVPNNGTVTPFALSNIILDLLGLQ
jgi:hypothetical protein